MIQGVTQATPGSPRGTAVRPLGQGLRTEPAVRWGREEVLFSACNESSWCELQALGPLDGKRVVCITAGGGRVLNLLMARPREILAVDLNPAQSALLELKIEGMRRLDHDGYLRFLGVRPSPARIATYQGLRRGLSPASQEFFDARLEPVREGILYQGKLEKFFAKLAVVLRLAGDRLDALFACEDLAAQRRAITKLETFGWRALAQTLTRRSVLEAFSGDPGFYRFVPPHTPIHRVIYDRVHRYFWSYLARENPLLQLALFGRYFHEAAMPHYLNAATFDRVKAALAGAHIERFTGRMEDALDATGPGSVDAFSLSDISSYLEEDAHHRLFEGMLRTSRGEARFCSRSNLAHRPLAREHAARVTRDPVLEHACSVRDHSCVHEFVIGVVS